MKLRTIHLERQARTEYKAAKRKAKALLLPFLDSLDSIKWKVHLDYLSTAARLSLITQNPLRLERMIGVISDETGIPRNVINSIADAFVLKLEMGIDHSIKRFTPRGYL